MNSLVSYEWLKEYVDLNGISPDEFAKRISLSGPAVEKMYPQGLDLDKIIVGHVTQVGPHPNADKLRLAKVDIGDQTLTVVCGGTNLKADQWVAVALIGARVKWHGQGELITLESVEIRGIKSEGMICASSEIGLLDAFPCAEREILDLSLVGVPLVGTLDRPAGMRVGTSMRVGTRPTPTVGMVLSDFLGLSSDVVMDIEVPSNRIDAMGMVGMAREAAAILKKKFLWQPANLPQPLLRKEGSEFRSLPLTKGEIKRGLTVHVAAKKLCPRYTAIRMEGVQVGPSPWWLKRRLLSAGIRPINNLVDISNYVMLELAQPTHMFDAAKINGDITVRLAREGEQMQALDGKMYQLDDAILVIADESKPIAIAGVMGGEETGVSDTTTSVIIESASFDPVCVRRGARKLNLQSDAQLRFEKGLSTEALSDALARVVEFVQEIAGGHVASKMIDVRTAKYTQPKFSITVDEVNALIGVPTSRTDMVDILKRLGFTVSASAKKITVKVPWWRDQDIEDGRDLVEEIARVRGYLNIPSVVPMGLATRPVAKELVWERSVREISKGAGLCEIYSYSFVSKDLLAKSGYDPEGMLHVQNPLSVEFEVMRTTLLPSLLQVASENRERFPDQRLFEVANVYYPTQTNLPDEQLELGALFMGMDNPWRQAKGYVEHVFHDMGIENLTWKRLSTDAFWHPGRTVQAFHDDTLIATVGEVSPRIASNFKFDGSVALVDIPLEHVIDRAISNKKYHPIPAFPEAKRDVAIVVDSDTEYAMVAQEIRDVDALISSVEWFDTYRGERLPKNKKSLAMHVAFSSAERTLESAEVDELMKKILMRLKEKCGAELRT